MSSINKLWKTKFARSLKFSHLPRSDLGRWGKIFAISFGLVIFGVILAMVFLNFNVKSVQAGGAATYQFTPVSGTIVTGTATTITSATAANAEGVNVGSWKGTLADDNFHWVVESTASGIDLNLDVGGVQLNGANTLIIQTEIDEDATAPALLFQICDWVSSTGVDAPADAQCTGGGWRTLNVNKAPVAPTTATAYTFLIYDGYWASGNTPISTPLTNFVNSSNRVKIRYFSTTNTNTSLAIDYLRIYAVINPVYSAAGFTQISGGAVTGSYASTTIGLAGTTNSASDNVYLSVPGTSATTSTFYLSFKNIKTYTGMNTILVRAEYSCSATGISHRPRIYNFTTQSWENLTTASIACSTTDATNAWAKSNININDYVSNGELRVGWTGLSVGTQAIRLDFIYVMLGSTYTPGNFSEVSFGTTSAGSATSTSDLDMTGTASTWNIATEDESTTFGHDYYPFDTDMDATVEEAAAANIDISVTPPSNAAITGLYFASRHMAGTGGTVILSLRDFSGFTTTAGGWVDVGAGGTTALTYTDNITAGGVGSGGTAGYITNPEDFIDTLNNKMNVRLRTSSAGATTNNSVTQWDFAMVSLQWVEVPNNPTKTSQFTPVSGTIVTGTATTITSATAANAEGVNVGSWKGTLADDNFHWVVESTASGIDLNLDVGGVQLNGANTLIIQTEIDEDATAPALLFQICDWVSSTGVDAPADAQCTGGGWRTLNVNKAPVAPTTATAYTFLIYDGYWASGNTPISTPLTNFVNSSNRVKIRYFSTTNTNTSLAIDYLRIYAVINPVYSAAGFTQISGGAVTGSYASTTIGLAGTTNSASDNVYLSVPGTSATTSTFYLSFKNIKTYTGMNTILVRAEYSCSATGISHRPRIYNFTTQSWENLTTASIACSTTDATNAWAKSNININDYVSNGELRVGWTGLSVGTQAIRLDFIYVMLGSTYTPGNFSEVSFGTTSAGSATSTSDLDMTGTASTWNIATEDESTTFGHDYYPFDTDMDATVEEAAAANIDISVTPPSNAAITGLYFASRHMAGTGGTVILSLRDFSGFTTTAGGWVNVGAGGTTALTYTDNITVGGVGTGGTAGYITNPEDFVDTLNNKMNVRLRTSSAGATTNDSVTQWDFAMVSLQWIETAAAAPSLVLTQEHFQWFQNQASTTPGSALAALNTAASGIATNDIIRLRMNVGVTSSALATSTQAFKIQYSTATSSGWTDVGATSSSAIWRGYDNAGVANSQTIPTLLIASSTARETYEETAISILNPTAISVGGWGEWDWVLQNNGASSSQTYYFRMVKSDGSALDSYTRWPALTTASGLPGAPGTPTYTNVSTSTLTVNWTAATGADYYKLERCVQSGTCPGGAFSQIATTTALLYNDSGLTPSTTYWYRLRATNAQGDGPYSASSSITTTAAGGYMTSGTLTSLIIDTQRAGGVAPNSIMFRGTLPAQTSVKFQFASSNSTGGPWNFVAWRSSDKTCQTTSFYPETGTALPNQPVEIKAICHLNHRYIRYRVFLETTDPAYSPEVTDIVLNYAK